MIGNILNSRDARVSEFYIKIHLRRAAGRGYSEIHLYMCVFMNVFMYVCNCVMPPGQTNKDADLKFGPHTPIDLI